MMKNKKQITNHEKKFVTQINKCNYLLNEDNFFKFGDKVEPKCDVIIKILQDIQEKDGHLSKEKLEYVSYDTGIPLSKIYGIVTFYSFFKLSKTAKNKIQVCDGTACHVRGSEKLIDEIKSELNIAPGEITEDSKFSHDVVRCLGMCASAPLVKINNDVYPKINPDDVKKILESFK